MFDFYGRKKFSEHSRNTMQCTPHKQFMMRLPLQYTEKSTNGDPSETFRTAICFHPRKRSRCFLQQIKWHTTQLPHEKVSPVSPKYWTSSRVKNVLTWQEFHQTKRVTRVWLLLNKATSWQSSCSVLNNLLSRASQCPKSGIAYGCYAWKFEYNCRFFSNFEMYIFKDSNPGVSNIRPVAWLDPARRMILWNKSFFVCLRSLSSYTSITGDYRFQLLATLT